jgi:hypothetical protein
MDLTFQGIINILQSAINRTGLTLSQSPIRNIDNPERLKWLIQEYSAFSNNAIYMLVSALIRNADWNALRLEILDNIKEEFGSETHDVPHLEIMRKGYRNELGIETDNLVLSASTETFLARMRKIFAHDDNAYVAGAVMVFEMTAIPEFEILDHIVSRYAKITERDLTKGDTRSYIDGHKLFEIGHAGRLQSVVEKFITTENSTACLSGGLAVVQTMNKWWEDLAWEVDFKDKYEYRP